MSDFASVVAGCQKASQEMTLDGWIPDDGDYTVAVAEVQTGVSKKNGDAWIRPTFTILDGDLANRQFGTFFTFPKDCKEATFSMKNAALLATCLAGEEVKDSVQVCNLIQGSTGKVLVMEVRRNQYTDKRTKQQKTATNFRFVKRIDA